MGLHRGFKMVKGQADIISSLPDEIIVHIISLLPTVYAVRTCLLSSRWRNLWLHIVNFKFHYDSHPCRSGDGSFVYSPERKRRFAIFVGRVISLCQSDNIQNFKLKCDGHTYLPHIISWINFALNRNVTNFYLDIFNGVKSVKQVPKFPQSILTCKTLVKLTVHTDFSVDIPNSSSFVCFPSLKFLSFELQYTDGDLIRKIFRCCPVLEDLSFNFHSDIKMQKFNIFIPTLKRLYIWSDNKFVVRTPNLEYLKIISSKFYLADEMPLVSKAFVESKRLSLLGRTTAEGNCAMELLRGISRTKFLTLSSCTMKALCLAFNGDFPTFPNLKDLKLESGCGWKLLPHFLSNSPNLEVLKLNKSLFGSSVSVYFHGDTHVPSCLLLRLKKIEMYYTRGQFGGFEKADLEVAKYLLKSSEVLEKFQLCCNGAVSKSIREKIHKYPKGSKACKFIFS